MGNDVFGLGSMIWMVISIPLTAILALSGLRAWALASWVISMGAATYQFIDHKRNPKRNDVGNSILLKYAGIITAVYVAATWVVKHQSMAARTNNFS